jgi:hypothetical protein
LWAFIGLVVLFIVVDRTAREKFNQAMGYLMVHHDAPALPPAVSQPFPKMHPGQLYTFAVSSPLDAVNLAVDLGVVGAIVQGPLAGTGQPEEWSGVFQWMGADNEPVENLNDISWISVQEVSPGGQP